MLSECLPRKNAVKDKAGIRWLPGSNNFGLNSACIWSVRYIGQEAGLK